ncbi:hypothetical protein IPL85_00350 [Candidatus Saccharibacteria bacterium]|nr:MAG: hypothetical protein IPL85_00350 [Candidatus Saccharibacteria bacterium]
MAQIYEVDGQARFDPESHQELCDALSPWLGGSVLSVTAVLLPNMQEGTDYLNRELRSDCGQFVSALFTVGAGNGTTVTHVRSFRWYPDGGGLQPWASDSRERGLSNETVDMIGGLACAEKRIGEKYGRILAGKEPAEGIAPQVLTREQYEKLATPIPERRPEEYYRKAAAA